jgi:hypothetical protein
MGKIAIRRLEFCCGFVKVPLTRGLFCIIDDADADLVGKNNWMANPNPYGYYARRIHEVAGVKEYIYMHRVIAQASSGEEVDHIDGDRLNNRRSNLRLCSRKENNANRGASRSNTSGIKGVSWHRKDKRWVATTSVNNKTVYLGQSLTKEGAAEIYRLAVIRLHGEFARSD